MVDSPKESTRGSIPKRRLGISHQFFVRPLLAIVVAAFAGGAVAREVLSTRTIAAKGLARPAEILVDAWGIPHIYARNEDDLFFAQGMNAARDRLFQIDLWRRRGLGRLAEVFGPAFVEQDKAARLFLYRGDMAIEWARYGPKAQRIATRFVDGINAYIDWLEAHPNRLPIEFRELRYRPAKWSPEDVVRIRSHGLTRNLTSEVARANVACKAGVKADEIRVGLRPPWETRVPEGLDPCLPKDVLKVFTLATQSVSVKASERKANALASVVLAEAALDRESIEGSNNWVIAPAKSATGRAIMANDPHRAYAAPSLRYLVHLNAPGVNWIGAGEPILPGVSLGHNGTVAFGITIFPIDQEDLYVYELNPANAREYRYGQSWEPMRVVREPIPIKAGEPVEAELLFTRHGPVVFTEGEKNRAFAVRSCWLEPGMSPYFVSIEAARAKSFPDFRRAIEGWGAPTLSIVYADVQGNIGWLPRGLAPKRPNWDGLMPVPGDGRYEWAGFWTGSELPMAFNPPSHYITTSNEMNLPDDYPYRERKIGFEWANESRHIRLDERMRTMPKISIEDSKCMQNDVLSIPARRLIALVRPLASEDPKASAALSLLRNWDALLPSSSAPAALEEVWWTRHLGNGFKQAVLPKEAADAMGAPDAAVMLDTLEKPETRFGENASAKRDQLLVTTLAAAYAEMEKLQGPDATQWQWGKLHHNFNEHALAGAVDESLRARLNVGPVPKHGSANTPNQSSYRASDFRQANGPSVRLVIDVGNWDNSWAVNHPGQSGDPDDPHYRDLAPLWRDGKYFPLVYSRSAVMKVARQRIVLAP